MKKAVLVIILIVIVIAAIVVWKYPKTQGLSEIRAQCKAQMAENAKFVSALKDSSGASCDSLTNADDRAECAAWSTGDASKCPESRKQECAPVAQHNPESCPDDPWCKALASGDSSLCNNNAILPGDQKECAAWAGRDEKFFEPAKECGQISKAILP